MSEAAMGEDVTIRLDGEDYVLRRTAELLQVGRRAGEEVTWVDEIDPDVLPDQARTALDRGDTDDEALRRALRGIAQAEVERGG